MKGLGSIRSRAIVVIALGALSLLSGAAPAEAEARMNCAQYCSSDCSSLNCISNASCSWNNHCELDMELCGGMKVVCHFIS